MLMNWCANDGASRRAADYRSDIDGLRVVAVLGVIVYHMKKSWMPGGFVGVDIFFVISGFVVTTSLCSEKRTADEFELVPSRSSGGEEDEDSDFIAFDMNSVDFYARRAKRLLPALLLVCCVTGYAFHSSIPSWEHDKLRDFIGIGIAGLCGNANNWMVFGLELPYWDPTGQELEHYNPFLHLWSLGVEEQFYIILPFLLRSASCSFVGFMSLLICLSVASLLLACYWSLDDSPIKRMYAFYLLPARFWELALGVIVACFQKALRRSLEKRSALVFCLDFLAVVSLTVSLLFTPSDAGFPFPWALLPTIAACLCIIVGMATETSLLGQFLGNRFLAYVGGLSYSMYLWHTPLLAYAAWEDAQLRRSAYGCILCGVVVGVISVTSFHVVENPIRRLRPSGKTVLFVSFVAIGIGVAYLQMFRTGGIEASSSSNDVFSQTQDLRTSPTTSPTLDPTHTPKPSSASVRSPTSGSSRTSLTSSPSRPRTISPTLGPTRVPTTSPASASGPTSATRASTTSIRTPTSDPTIATMASTTSVPTPALQCQCRVIAPTEHTPVTTSNDLGLPPCFQPHSLADAGSTFPEFRQGTRKIHLCFMMWANPGWASTVRSCLSRSTVPTVYLVGDSHSISTRFAVSKAVPPGYEFKFVGTTSFILKGAPQFFDVIVSTLKQILKQSDIVVTHERLDPCKLYCCSPNNFQRRMTMLLDACQASGTKVLMLGDNPLLPQAPDVCMLPGNSGLCKTSVAAQLALQAPKREVIARLMQSHAGTAFFFDQLPLFCFTDGTCLATVPGTTTRAYYDVTHVNQWGAEQIWPFLCNFMASHVMQRASSRSLSGDELSDAS